MPHWSRRSASRTYSRTDPPTDTARASLLELQAFRIGVAKFPQLLGRMTDPGVRATLSAPGGADRVRGAFRPIPAAHPSPSARPSLPRHRPRSRRRSTFAPQAAEPPCVYRRPSSRNFTRVVVARGHMRENDANLSSAAREELEEEYAGTRLRRQELSGELLEDVKGVLWKGWMLDVEARRSQRRARISSIMARDVLVELGLVGTPRRLLPEFPVKVADCSPRPWCFSAAEALNAATACGWPISCAITSRWTIPTGSAARSMPAVIISSRRRTPPGSRSGPVPAPQWSHVLMSGVPAWSLTEVGLAGHGMRRLG